MFPPHTLLIDSDNDGHFDNLRGAIYLHRSPSKEYVGAAAEIVAWLACDALCLPLTVQTWSPQQPSIFVGQFPEDIPAEFKGTEARFYSHAFLLVAATDTDLMTGAKHLGRWPLQATLRILEQSATPSSTVEPPVSSLAFRDGLVTLRLAGEIPKGPDWSTLPTDLLELTTPTARHTNPNAAPSARPPRERPPKRHFSLAQAFQGGGLFTGTPHAPEALLGNYSIEAATAEALHVAARLSTTGLQSLSPLTGTPESASVRFMLDSTSSGEVRINNSNRGSVLEITGGTPQALAQAGMYFANEFPYLPDGTDLEGLEANLVAFLKGETPFGRVAAVAALKQRVEAKAQRALLPHPPSNTPRLLGFPITNTARDGECTRWTTTFVWEGCRLLEALTSLKWEVGDSVTVESYLSEAKSVRASLQKQVETLLEERSVKAQVVCRSAYKPGLCWLLEEVGPRLTQVDAIRLHVQCALQRDGLETEDRWLRELYPVADLLEQAYGVRVTLDVSVEEETYKATAFNNDGEVVFESHLSPPTLEAPLNGIPEMGFVSPTTGQVTVRRGSELLLQQHLPTDRDLLWQWFTCTVLPEVKRHVTPRTQGPYFGELSVVISASEPDEPLGLDHEHLSATESLHEDIYFGTLEALHHAAELDTKDRSLAPGRILPFCTAKDESDASAKVMLRTAGSHTLGFLDTNERVHEVTHYPLTIRTTSIKFVTDDLLHTFLHLEVDEQAAAHHFKAQLEWGIAHRSAFGLWDPFPRGSRVTIQVDVAEQPFATIEVPESDLDVDSTIKALPDRPTLTREVVSYARNLNQKFPHVYLRPLRESLLGAPLVALELTSPTPSASRARLNAWKPTVLVSARQHANEPSSTNATFRWLEEELAQGDLLKHVNIVFHPLENPDGARLHSALCQLAARHMHHAARYTGVGADLQANPVSRGAIIPESRLRLDTGRRWQPSLHLNCHGYPAHEWVRANGGYVPRHFEAWSLPFGYFTILIGPPQHEELLEHLKNTVAEALALNPRLQQFTAKQVNRALRYLRSSAFPFTLKEGFPFLVTVKEALESKQDAEKVFSPSITVITEVPDETVSGVLWQWCIEGHQVVSRAVTHELYMPPKQQLPPNFTKHIK